MDASAWDARYRERELVWSAEPNAFVVRELSDLPAGRALDLAAGEGRNAIWLAERGWEVEAVEFSSVAIDKGRRLAEHRGVEVRWTHADLTTSPELAPADLVLLAYLQLPEAAIGRVLRWAASLVGAGGTLLVVSHARSNLEHGVGGPQDAAVLATVDQLVGALGGTGLVPLVAGEVTREVEVDEGPREAIDVLVRATRPAARG